ADAREKALGKAGGTIVKAKQLQAITDMAKVDFPGADDADIRVRSRPLAEEMVKMMRDQHLSESEASRRVYEAARGSGVFSGLRMAPVITGSKPGKPLAAPAKPADVQPNIWYLFPEDPAHGKTNL